MLMTSLFASVQATNRRIAPPPGGSPPPSPPPPGVPTTFDAHYSGGFTLAALGSTPARPSPTEPSSRSTGYSNASYTDPNFGARWHRVSMQADDSGATIYALRNDYPKRQMFNCDDTLLLGAGENGWWHLFNATTFAHLSPTGGSSGRLLWPRGQNNDVQWHPTLPNVLRYMRDEGSLIIYELDTDTGVETSWRTISLPSGWAAAGVTRLTMKSEGRPSNDHRYWCFMGLKSDFSIHGVLVYDTVSQVVVDSVAPLAYRPNWVGMSQDGTYAIVQWHNFFGSLTYANAQLRATLGTDSSTAPDGTRAYPRAGLSGGTWFTLDTTGEHGDLGVDAAGNQVWVSACYSPHMDVTEGETYYRVISTSTAYLLNGLRAYGQPGHSGMHAGCCNFDRQGYALITMDGPGATPRAQDGKIIIARLTPGNVSTDHRVAAHHLSNGTSDAPNNWGTSVTSPLWSCNRSMTMLVGGTDWLNPSNARKFIPYYFIGLPSTALG